MTVSIIDSRYSAIMKALKEDGIPQGMIDVVARQASSGGIPAAEEWAHIVRVLNKQNIEREKRGL